MEEICELCHDPLDLTEWKHPGTDESHTLCAFCRRSVIGVCHECNEILVSIDRYGVNEAGYKICSACAERHELGDDEKKQG